MLLRIARRWLRLAGQALLRGELSAQAKAQSDAIAAQVKAHELHNKETAETMSALQAQTAEIQTVIEQQRDMVASAHARADDGHRAADSIAETLAHLMLRTAGSETVPSCRSLVI